MMLSTWICRWLAVFTILSCLCSFSGTAFANFHSEAPKVVRVGYFAFDGYHNIDSAGVRYGYGYEVLQKMKRYENWQYEYVGYDKSWGEMLEMLKHGEIDLLTSALVTPERLQDFDYSSTNVGVSSIALTVRKDDMRYDPGRYETYNGMRVGALRSNSKNNGFEKFAQENHIFYTAYYYDTIAELEQALHEKKEIDAIVTGTLRKMDGEKILDEFNTQPYFVMVKKGNAALLSEVNHALVRMNTDDPQWKTRLNMKYYKIEGSDELNLTFEDRNFIEHLNINQRVFRVLVDTEKRPYAYYDKNGQIRGIAVDLFAMIANKIGIKYEYLPVHSEAEYNKALASGQADLVLDGKVSLHEAERLGLHNVGTYMSTPLALYYKRENSGVAIHRAATTSDLVDNAHAYFDGRVALEVYDSAQDCLDLLAKDKVDALLIRSMRASDFLTNDYKNEYMALVIPEQTVSYSLLVNAKEHAMAPALFAKACASITNKDVELVALKYKDMLQRDMDLKSYIYMRPGLFLSIAVIMLGLSSLVLILQVKRQREIAENNQALKEANAFLAERDSLTGGYNRQGFINAVEALRSHIELKDYDILFIDVKNIKAINEMLGVEQGDAVLKQLYKNLQASFLAPKVVARTESDHFVLLVKRQRLDYQELKNLLVLEKTINNREIKVFCRCGIYEIEDAEMDLLKMVNNARLARRYMGNDFHESYIIYQQYMSDDYVDQAEVLSTFEGALANNEFKVYYQPIVHTATGRIASAEALVRWIRPNGKLVAPNHFVPVLEKNGLISKVDNFMAESVYAFLLERQQQGLFRVPVSVNLSWMDFYDEHLVDGVLQKASHGELDKKTIRYEITETTYANMESNKQGLLTTLRECGIDILLDDFGSGYSSFGMLQDYHFAILKLDMSFIRKLVANVKVQLIVQAVIDMCHRLKIRVVAEGVEQEREVQILRDMGCDYIQGYYFSKPLSQEEFVAYLEKESKLV